ncbi:MFS transporter [Candidatus Lucifugimonas marina]|uniref:MFS transporter n=1 Tax=Candidatus Lucifugimonas marina TaxID=3038979 RepID=A0AAJ5ZED8_9CHLR|nr:MFS transporter [SAR202 cluster bacterium JH702]MDG0869103.1 MFS transporter [SAR202 cluster bacterium JH639]WFG35723.1 MFS transporter [SAR202 cluster bacterium JH545]WFG39669.1 MFS transporter [SAR202 cluster bacterium JH1073]
MKTSSSSERNWPMSRGWAIIWASFFTTAFASGASQYGFGMFVESLEQEFGWTRTQINLSLSIGLISGLLSPIIGWGVDKYGSRTIMTVSLLIVAASFILRAGMTELWQWYALSALLAIGFPGTLLPVGKLVGVWFPATRGRMMGTAITGNNVFGLIGVPLMSLVIQTEGWRLAYAIIGVGVLAVAVAVWFIVRSAPLSAQASSENSGDDKIEAFTANDYSLQEALKSRKFWLLLTGVTCAGFSYPSFMTQLIPHMQSVGWSSSKSTLVLTVLAGTALASKVSWGLLSERLTARISFVIAILIMASGVVLVTLAGSSIFVWPAIVYFGAGFGGIGPLMSLVVMETFGLRNFGSIQGVVAMVLATVPVLIGPILAGSLFDLTGSYATSFWIVSGIFAAGGVLVLSVRSNSNSAETAE